LFVVSTSKSKDKNKINFDKNGQYEFIGRTSVNYGVQGYLNKLEYEPNPKNTFSLAQVGETVALFRDKEWYGSQNMFVLTPKQIEITKNHLFFESVFYRALRKYSEAYTYPLLEDVKELMITLPEKDGYIDYSFMENIVAELETIRVAELEAYLSATDLKNYILTEEENAALIKLNLLNWKPFNLENLFGKSTRGKRLKSDDRIPGILPFVTAGEADEGISGYIANNVQIFEANTTTIDMFGSAKYRNYKYGADDHVAIVHTEKLEKHAAIFVTTAIHKSSHNGQFSYDKNFYSKDADALNIMLPVDDGEPDYKYMSTVIRAIKKIVIRDVVLYSDAKINKTRTLINND